jgi:hypothetical protein
MESNTILVNKTIIPLSNIETLSEYQLICMFKILAIESYYINIKRKIGNSIRSEGDYKKHVKMAFNIYIDYIYRDSMWLKISKDYRINDCNYMIEIENLKASGKHCDCPYKYREIKVGLNRETRKLQRIDKCQICQKKFSMKYFKKEHKFYGVYLASECTDYNILNILPVDIAKNVIQYIA